MANENEKLIKVRQEIQVAIFNLRNRQDNSKTTFEKECICEGMDIAYCHALDIVDKALGIFDAVEEKHKV